MSYRPNFPEPGDDIIDSRDVIFHIDDLQSDLDAAESDEEREEIEEQLAPLLALAEEGENLEDWEYGAKLVHDSHFEQFAQDFADDIGAIDRNASWPLDYIDWEQAARELQMDYTPVEYAGHTYWAG